MSDGKEVPTSQTTTSLSSVIDSSVRALRGEPAWSPCLMTEGWTPRMRAYALMALQAYAQGGPWPTEENMQFWNPSYILECVLRFETDNRLVEAVEVLNL